MSTKLITPAAALPIAVETAVRYCRALEDEVDLVVLCLKAAVAAVEDYTGRCLMTQTFCQQLADWPATAQSDNNANVLLRPTVPAVRYLELERTPLLAVTSLKYYPEDLSAQVTIATSKYSADVAAIPGRVTLLDGYVLPTLAVRFDAIELIYTTGQGTVESGMNPMLNIACLQLMRHLYDNPAAVDSTGRLSEMPLSFKHLLRSQKVGL